MTEYDSLTGEPRQYSGFVSNGNITFDFTIQPNAEVVWANGIGLSGDSGHSEPTMEPSLVPTLEPTMFPTNVPSGSPVVTLLDPTQFPTLSPSSNPNITLPPTNDETVNPSLAPT